MILIVTFGESFLPKRRSQMYFSGAWFTGFSVYRRKKTMQKTIKSIRAILLAIVLAVGVFAVIPAPVYAVAPTLTPSATPVTNITETEAFVNWTLNTNGVGLANFYIVAYIESSSPQPTTEQQIVDTATNSSPIGSPVYTDVDSGSDFSASSRISGLPPATGIIVYVVAQATDGSLDFSNILTFTFKTWPTITSAASFSCVAGTGGSFDLTALGTGAINWTLSGAPAGVSLGSPLLIVAPTVPAGVYNFTVTATSTLGSTSQNFTLTVTSVGTSGGGGGGGAAATTGVSPKTDDATGGNMFLFVMMLLLAAGAVYTGRKVAKANK